MSTKDEQVITIREKTQLGFILVISKALIAFGFKNVYLRRMANIIYYGHLRVLLCITINHVIFFINVKILMWSYDNIAFNLTAFPSSQVGLNLGANLGFRISFTSLNTVKNRCF